MKYIVNRTFNNFIVGQILDEKEVSGYWVADGLVLVVENKDDFMQMIDESVEMLDPEVKVKPKNKKV